MGEVQLEVVSEPEEAEKHSLTIEEIEAQLGEPQTEFEFSVSLLPGAILRARIVQDATEMLKIHRRSEQFGNLFKAVKVKDKMKQNLPGPLREFEGVSTEVAQKCAFLSEMMIEPAVPKKAALSWAQKRGFLFAELYIACERMGQTQAVENEADLLEDEKND